MAKIGSLIKKQKDEAEKRQSYFKSAYTDRSDATRTGVTTGTGVTSIGTSLPAFNVSSKIGSSAPKLQFEEATEVKKRDTTPTQIYEEATEKAVEEPTFLERIGKTLSGAGKQSGSGFLNAQGTLFEAGQGQRDRMYSDMAAQYKKEYEQAQKDLAVMEQENREKPGTYNDAEVQGQRYILEGAQRKYEALSSTDVKRAQPGTVKETQNLADRLAESGQKDTARAKEGLGTVGKFAVDVGTGMTQLAADAVVGAATGLGTAGTIALRGFGSGAQQARQEGATLGQQIAYGLGSATVEALTEKIGSVGNFNTELFGKGAADEILEGVVAAVEKAAKTETGAKFLNKLTSAGVGFLSEGIEEFVSGVVDPALKRLTYSDEAIDWKQTLQDSAYDFLVGGAIGSVMGGIGGTDTSRFKNASSQQETVSPAASATVKQTTAQAENTRIQNPESEVLDSATEAWMSLGMNLKTAKQRAEITQKLIRGEEVTVRDVNRLDPTNKAAQKVFSELTGVRFPEGKLSYEQAHNLFRSASTVAQTAQMAQNAAQEHVQMQTRERAKVETEIAQMGAEVAQAVQEQGEQQSAQAQQKDAEIPVQPQKTVTLKKANGQKVENFEEFAAAVRSQNLDWSDAELQERYRDYRDTHAAITYRGRQYDKEQFRNLARTELGGKELTDQEADGAFSMILDHKGSEEFDQKYAENRKTLEKSVSRWKQSLTAMTAVKDVTVDDSLAGSGVNAYYNKDTGAIAVNPDLESTDEVVGAILSHEMLHSIADEGVRSQTVRDIIDTLSTLKPELVEQRDAELQKLTEIYQAQEDADAVKEGRESRIADRAYVEEEYAANLMRQVFKDDALLEKLATEKPTFVQRVKQVIDDLVETLKGNADAVAERRELEALQARVVKALKVSAENEESGAKFSLSSNTDGATMKETTQEGTGYGTDEARAETEEDFIRRSHEAAREVRTGAGFVFGYRRPVLLRSVSGSATEAQRALSELGVPSEVVEGDIEWNRNGVTRSRGVKEATNLAGQLVVISDAADIAPLNVAGHEAYHFKRNTPERDLYSDAVGNNLLFGSEAFMRYQQRIADAYFGGDVDVSDIRQYAKFEEELFAYISGDLHEGTNEQYLRPMFRDFEAVKQAWSAFTQSMKHQASEKSGASSLPKQSYTYEALIQKPDVSVTQVPMRTVPTKGKRLNVPEIAKAGREQAELRQGADTQQRVVFVPDLKADVLIGAPGARHGLTGNKTNSSTMNTAEVTYALPQVLQNSVAVNEQSPRAESDGEYSYVLFGYARREDGKEYLVKSTVNHFTDNKSVVEDVEVYDVLKGIKARKTKDPRMEVFNSVSGSQGSHTGSPAARHPNGTASATISVAELLDVVKENYPELLPNSVRDHYGITEPVQATNLRYSISPEFAEWYNKQLGTNYTADSLKERLNKAAEEHGTIPAGERAYRESQIPRSMTGKDRVSQAARTVYEAKATPAERLQTIEDVVAKGQVSDFPEDTKIRSNRARAKLKRDGWTKAYTDWIADVRAGKVSADLMAMGAHLLNNAGNNAEATAEQYAELFIEYAELNRNAGRSLQAARILKRLSPEGKLYGIQREVNKMNDANRSRAEQKKGFDPEKWAEENEIKLDTELVELYRKAQTDEERDAIMDQIQQNVADQMPASLSEKLNNWRYLAMLGNFKTQGRNILGNAAFQVPRLIKEEIAGGMETVAQKAGLIEDRTRSVKRDGATYKAAWKDYENVRDIILNGSKLDEKTSYLSGIQEKRRIYKNAVLEGYRKVTNAAMDMGDSAFCRITYADSLASFMAANGTTWEKAPEALRERGRRHAIKEAAEATYRDNNAFSETILKMRFKNPNNWVQKGVNAVVEGVLPFKKTPANVLARGVEYSPLGLIKAVMDSVQAAKPNNEITGNDVINDLAKTVTGSGLLVMGYFMAKNGLLTGGGPEDEKDKEFWELQGNQAYSFVWDGKSYTVDWLAPEAIPVLTGANLAEIAAEEGWDLDTITKAITRITDPMLEMSMLQGVNDTFENIANTQTVAALPSLVLNSLWSYALQYVPTLFGQAERAADNTRRATYKESDSGVPGGVQYALGKLSQKFPGWDYNQIPYIDQWGRMESNYETTWGNTFAQFLSPSYKSVESTSAMEEELQRLYDATGESEVLPSEAPKYFTVNGERRDLTAEEYVTYATVRGATAHDLLSDLTSSAAYQKLSDAAKVGAVGEVYSYARDLAKAEIVGDELPDDQKFEPLDTSDYGVSAAEYTALEAAVKGFESLKYKDRVDEDGKAETITNSRDLQIMEYVYANTRGLSKAEYEALFEALGVGKTIRKYSETIVQRKLNQMRKQAK